MLPSTSFAHLAGGEDKTVGEYVVDFGYDPETPTAGEQTVLAFHIHDAETEEAVDYTHVWVRIRYNGEILAAVNVAQNEHISNFNHGI